MKPEHCIFYLRSALKELRGAASSIDSYNENTARQRFLNNRLDNCEKLILELEQGLKLKREHPQPEETACARGAGANA